jgi:hypothetical protein
LIVCTSIATAPIRAAWFARVRRRLKAWRRNRASALVMSAAHPGGAGEGLSDEAL